MQSGLKSVATHVAAGHLIQNVTKLSFRETPKMQASAPHSLNEQLAESFRSE